MGFFVSTNHTFKIHSDLPTADLPAGDIISDPAIKADARNDPDPGMSAPGAPVGGRNAGAVNHGLVEVVWRYFEKEIREAVMEVQAEITKAAINDDPTHRKQKRK